MMTIYVAGMPLTLLMDLLPRKFSALSFVVLLLGIPLNFAILGAVITFAVQLFKRRVT